MKKTLVALIVVSLSPLLVGQGCVDSSPAPPSIPIPPPVDPPITPPPSVEQPLEFLSCDSFPKLPEYQEPEQTQILDPDESAYYWTHVFCGTYMGVRRKDPQPVDCTRLLIGTGGNTGWDEHRALFRFDWPQYTTSGQIATEVKLLVYILDWKGWFSPNPLSARWLVRDWWRDCPADPVDWRAVCEDDLPWVVSAGSVYLRTGTDGKLERWLEVNLSSLHSERPPDGRSVHGLVLEAGAFDFYTLAGPRHEDENLRPRLSILPGVETVLKFPLEKGYEVAEAERVRRGFYRFGSWWDKQRCDGKSGTGPRMRHTAVDWPAEPGDPVYAVRGGYVRRVHLDSSGVFGWHVVIEHDDNSWTSTYTHVTPKVLEGVWVKRGDEIATIYRLKENDHLHFQIRLAPYHKDWSLRGRLPERGCWVASMGVDEPAWPEKFIDPNCQVWD